MASERVVHGDVASEHIVGLFDSPDSLAEALSSFVGDAVRQGATTLLVIRPEHWALTLDRLGANGHTVSREFAQGRLMVLDAEQTLASCVRAGLPDSDSFERTIGDLVRRLATPSTRLRIYGEMVDLLAAQADFRGARTLETFWNRLAAECSFTLLCGYSSVSFGHPRSSGALELICRAHTNVTPGPPTTWQTSWCARPAVRRRRPTLGRRSSSVDSVPSRQRRLSACVHNLSGV